MAKYISDRDGYASNPSHIYLTSGASEAIRVRDNSQLTYDNDFSIIWSSGESTRPGIG